LATPGYIVRKAVSIEVASKYKSAIEAAGGVCDLVPEAAPSMTLDVDLPAAAPSIPEATHSAIAETILPQGDPSPIPPLDIDQSAADTLTLDANQAPDLSVVRNRTAWLAAFGPSLSGIVLLLIGVVFGWNWDDINNRQLIKLSVFIRLPIIFFFMWNDHHQLKKQGFDPGKLGIVGPENIFMYLFSRAKAFGHSKAYAITYCVVFGLEVLWLLFVMAS